YFELRRPWTHHGQGETRRSDRVENSCVGLGMASRWARAAVRPDSFAPFRARWPPNGEMVKRKRLGGGGRNSCANLSRSSRDIVAKWPRTSRTDPEQVTAGPRGKIKGPKDTANPAGRGSRRAPECSSTNPSIPDRA